MKRILLVCLFLLPTSLWAESSDISASIPASSGTLAQKINQPAPAKKRNSPKKFIKFDYTDEDLIDIINQMAAEKGVNIILPTGANAITSKVTLHIEPLLDLDEAWDILLSILDLADYSLIADNTTYTIVKNSKAISREPLPLYVGIAPEDLPDSDTRIRYLYYLTNIKVSPEANNMVMTLLKELLPDNTLYKVDTKTNALLIVDKSNNIKSLMTILMSLDQITFKETLDVIKLRYTSADVVAKLFSENILLSEKDKNKYRMEAQTPPNEVTYFSKQIRILPEVRTNSLILLGKEQAVQQIKDFIYKYIDIELETGKSILHVYQLQYLDAAALEPVLKNIVASSLAGGTGQARGTQLQTGPERFFEGVLIKADTPRSEQAGYFGGNKLVVAAKNEDWQIIKKLLEELDKPQRTVIIEVLVVDLTLTDQKLLGASIRNAQDLPMPNGVNFQTVQVTPQYIPDTVPPTPPTTLATDLLGRTLLPGPQSFANTVPPGSFLIAANDSATGQTWGIAQLIKLFSTSKILSHPHVIAVNNKESLISLGETRLLPDEATAGTAATTIRQSMQTANLTVRLTPRISAGNVVNVKINVDVNEFIAGPTTITKNARITRNIETNANIKSEDILALGGLISITTNNAQGETPVLGKVPILGWLFKNRNTSESKTNLTVFISPTIVEPRLRGGVGEYTKDYIGVAKTYAAEGNLFDSLRDPITRFFFASSNDSQGLVDSFLEKDELKKDLLELEKSEMFGHEATEKPTTFAKKERKKNTNGNDPRGNHIKQLLEQEENPLKFQA